MKAEQYDLFDDELPCWSRTMVGPFSDRLLLCTGGQGGDGKAIQFCRCDRLTKVANRLREW